MHTETVRISIILPKDLADTMKQMTRSRSRSRFICDSIREYIQQQRNRELERQLEEGYRAVAKEGASIAKEFEAADLEGWDEY